MRKFWGAAAGVVILYASSTRAAGVPDGCTQLIVGIAPDWESMHARLQLFQREKTGAWHSASPAFRALLGKHGLAWGSGLAGQDEPGLHKKERDGRAPAGLFRLGAIYTFDNALPAGATYPMTHLTAADAWVDDPENPHYNEHVTVDLAHPPDWFAKARMRPNDFAYRWLVEIRHNSDPPIAGNGSAIFFHIRRGIDTPTAGCTSMAEEKLVALIRWLRADREPCYLLLPKSEYGLKWQEWSLPAPTALEAMGPREEHLPANGNRPNVAFIR